MSDALKSIQDADTNIQQTIASGFTELDSSMSELSSDIQVLNDKIAAGATPEEIAAEAARLNEVSTNLATRMSAAASAVRDAVPTPATTPATA